MLHGRHIRTVLRGGHRAGLSKSVLRTWGLQIRVLHVPQGVLWPRLCASLLLGRCSPHPYTPSPLSLSLHLSVSRAVRSLSHCYASPGGLLLHKPSYVTAFGSKLQHCMLEERLLPMHIVLVDCRLGMESAFLD